MEFVYDDGGREAAGYKGSAGDCVCRAISIASERPYGEIYNLINEYGKMEKSRKHMGDRSSARTGVYRETTRKIMLHLGFRWVPTMKIGQGCKVHMKSEELPPGRIVVSLSKHCAAVIDGVLHDTYDCSRDGTRCVYGYFIKEK